MGSACCCCCSKTEAEKARSADNGDECEQVAAPDLGLDFIAPDDSRRLIRDSGRRTSDEAEETGDGENCSDADAIVHAECFGVNGEQEDEDEEDCDYRIIINVNEEPVEDSTEPAGESLLLPRAQEQHTRYIQYPDPDDSVAMGNSPGPENMWGERYRFLKRRSELAKRILAYLNIARTGDNADLPEDELQFAEKMLRDWGAARPSKNYLQPLTLNQRLSKVARLAWQDRSQVTDGFVAVPGCVFKSRGVTYGCLAFYTWRTKESEIACLPRSLLQFLLSCGRPPSDEDALTYPDPSNAIFQENCRNFLPQLLSSECCRAGLHMDMVLSDGRDSRNLICLIIIFDKPVSCQT